MDSDNQPNKSAELNESDNKSYLHEVAMRQAKLGGIAKEIETILFRENLTLGEWSEIIDLMNTRTSKVFQEFTIKNISELFHG